MNLLTLPAIAGAVSTTVGPVTKFNAPPRSLAIQANFAYGSGGTTVDAYVQTTLDGSTWIDIAQFHFTTSAAKFVYNLNSQTAVTSEYTPTDGSLTANTSKDGILGPQFRVKYASAGTYAGATSLSIDIAADQAGGA